MSKPISVDEMTKELRMLLDDAFKPQPSRVLIFDTRTAIYEINEYPDGWSLQRSGAEGTRTILKDGMTEEEMWMILKLLK